MAICSACLDEYERLDLSSTITGGDEEQIVQLVRRDLAATVGPALEHIAIVEAARLRLVASTVPEYERRLVEDIQQRLHDEHLDTTWPKCPQHPNHPLWYADGWWSCPTGGAVARVGELGAVEYR